ncbi:MAG: HicA family toxin-antitoxin system [Tetragenococcus koreensis]|nr:HicA family toxin-antitoxin system [Tetragenococcus koreensis]MDN6291423.1 HicA family toxin-antitoxin system [Tetragenococcus koreensis]MDN6345374.1 HicA family toxin-antitoxin system [Tetragenococcus koreensis]
MGKEKELQKIKNNPKSVTPERLEALCKKYGFMWRQGTNHSITSHALLEEESYPIPRHKPIKPVYVKHVIGMIEKVIELEEGLNDER